MKSLADWALNSPDLSSTQRSLILSEMIKPEKLEKGMTQGSAFTKSQKIIDQVSLIQSLNLGEVGKEAIEGILSVYGFGGNEIPSVRTMMDRILEITGSGKSPTFDLAEILNRSKSKAADTDNKLGI